MAAKKTTAKRKKPAGKKGRPTELAPGTVIEKTFKGSAHKVQVTADGYLYNRKSYASLTAVALAITGYKAISGPRFFGTDAKGGAA